MRNHTSTWPALVLTIGHSNRSLQEFLDMLQGNQVKLVIDMRKLPGSRSNPQFNQDTLPQALDKYGIGYVHMPKLGGLRRRRRDSPNAGWKNACFQGYADYMLTLEFEEDCKSYWSWRETSVLP